MDTRWVRSTVALAIVSLAAPVVLGAQSFEGVVRQRTVEIDEDRLMEMMYDEDREEPEFDSEEEWVAWTAAALFDIPISELIADGSADVGR